MKLIHTHTPETLDSALLAVCQQLVPQGTPEYVACRCPETGEPGSGEAVAGWVVTVWDAVLVQCVAQFVTATPQGRVFFSSLPQERILFIPDPSLSEKMTQSPRPAVQLPLSQRSEVKRFIAVSEEERGIMGRYPVRDGKIQLPADEAKLLGKLAREKESLAIRINLLLRNPDSPCLCGSGKKFRKCCKTRLARLA